MNTKLHCFAISLAAILSSIDGLSLVSAGVVFASPAAAETSATGSMPASVPAPITEVRSTLDKVVAAVSEFSGEKNLPKRRAKLREIINPRFDFEEMSKRSLGPEWPKRTTTEQSEFVSVFSELLASTYLARVETVTGDMVTVDKEKVEFPKAIVRTTVKNKGDTFPIDYKLQYEEGGWRVYDVVIENIGLVANYRNEFAGIMHKEEFAGLMQKLREKSVKPAA